MTPFSLVVTTFNNAATLDRCLGSAGFADQVLVLDSGSDDGSRDIARRHQATLHHQDFAGYGPQKAHAVSLARHDWVLLLDADEVLSPALADEIRALRQAGFSGAGYTLAREEWLMWRWPARGTRLTRHLRLFDRRRVRFGTHPVHAAPETTGPVRALRGRLRHLGEPNLATRITKLNRYSSDAAAWRLGRQRAGGLRMLVAPWAAFWREYIHRRHFLNGWAGLIAARTAAFHATLRHAKMMELERNPELEPPDERA